jgi:protein SCO1/2
VKRCAVVATAVSIAWMAGCVKRYPVEGMVLSVDAPRRSLLVSHRAIPGYMPAMAMPFRAAAGEPFERLRPGTRVTFELHVNREAALARRIRVVEANQVDADLRLEPPEEKLAIGSAVPDFTLLGEHGRPVRLSDYAGRVVAINFLYTRCPLPEVCPRLAAAFSAMQRRFRDRIPGRIVLLSITLDPGYDTPEVLVRYAKSLRADPLGWRFLTGSKEQIETVARRFGLIHWPEEGVIVHTSVTAIVGADGKLKALVEGSSYPLEQLSDLLAHHLGGESR